MRIRRRRRTQNLLTEVKRNGQSVGAKIPALQPKLKIGQPNDKHEKEADQVAEKVVSQPGASIQKQAQKEEEQPQAIQKMAEKEKPEGIRKQEEESSEESDKEEESPDLQKQEDSSSEVIAEKEQVSPKSESPNSQQVASPSVEVTLNATKRGGQPLPKSTRIFMEQGIRANFQDVRIHTGKNAIEMNRALRSEAFTHGRNIYFNQGKYHPGTLWGKRLLAHELTHVAQQKGWSSKHIQMKGVRPSRMQPVTAGTIIRLRNGVHIKIEEARNVTAFKKSLVIGAGGRLTIRFYVNGKMIRNNLKLQPSRRSEVKLSSLSAMGQAFKYCVQENICHRQKQWSDRLPSDHKERERLRKKRYNKFMNKIYKKFGRGLMKVLPEIDVEHSLV